MREKGPPYFLTPLQRLVLTTLAMQKASSYLKCGLPVVAKEAVTGSEANLIPLFLNGLSPAFGSVLEVRPDADSVEALTPEWEALWARLLGFFAACAAGRRAF